MHWVPLFDENTSRKIGAFLPEVDRVPGKKKKKKKERRATSCKYCTDRLLGWFTQLRRGPYKRRTFLFFYLIGLGSLSLHALGVASVLSLYRWIT